MDRRRELDAYVNQIREKRRHRNLYLRTSPFSELALVQRHQLAGQQELVIGASLDADIRLDSESVHALHATVEKTLKGWVLRAVGAAEVRAGGRFSRSLKEFQLSQCTSFRIDRFTLRHVVHPVWRELLEVYDPNRPDFCTFTRLQYFPIRPGYRVTGELQKFKSPLHVQITYSDGSERKCWQVGELHFALFKTHCRLHIYRVGAERTLTDDQELLLMFTDETTGIETYPSGRYLKIHEEFSPSITVDFNKAYNPSCNYSAIFTCPCVTPENHVPICIRAGEKCYTPPRYRARVHEPLR